MRHQACLPQSWWQFSVEHTVHMYNRTPQRRLNWQTPYELLYGERPSIDHLRVFGCGAYVFIPAETRANKLAPKSELMIYLGNASGTNSFVFMRAPNNTLYYAAHCIFDESMFPKCPKQAKLPTTWLHKDAPIHHYHEDIPPVDEEVTPPTWVRETTRNPSKGATSSKYVPPSKTRVEPPELSQDELNDSSSSESEMEPEKAPSPPP